MNLNFILTKEGNVYRYQPRTLELQSTTFIKLLDAPAWFTDFAISRKPDKTERNNRCNFGYDGTDGTRCTLMTKYDKCPFHNA